TEMIELETDRRAAPATGRGASVRSAAFRAAALLLLLAGIAGAAEKRHAPKSKPTPTPAASNASAAPPNILLVTLDTVHADHCSAYGYSRPTTPRLADLASSGVRLVDAYAPMPTTLPSHATMFTGLDPRSHGVNRNGATLGDSSVTLAEVLARHG